MIDRLGAPNARSTSTTRACLLRLRASVIAAMVVPTLRSAPITVIRRPRFTGGAELVASSLDRLGATARGARRFGLDRARRWHGAAT